MAWLKIKDEMDTIISLLYCKVEMHLVNVVALVYVKCRVIYRGHGRYKSKKKIISLKTWKQKKEKKKSENIRNSFRA